jgi:DNA polymerase-3 subunit delta
MIITVTGPNSFALQRDLKDIVKKFVSEYSDMGLERLDGEEVEYDRIRESLESLPFLASKKLVVLRSPGANKQFTENAERLLGELPDTTDVVIFEPKLDKRLTYAKFLKKSTDYREYNELDSPQLARWLVETAKKQGGELSISDASLLINRVGVSQQHLNNELIKIILYNPKITKDTIMRLTDQTLQSTVFDLLDAALGGQTKRAVALYKEQRAAKTEPAQIIALMSWQLHVLALIKTAGNRELGAIAQEAKINPFVVRKSSVVASKLSIDDLTELIRSVRTLDVRLKSESIDADEAMLLLLVQMGSE